MLALTHLLIMRLSNLLGCLAALGTLTATLLQRTFGPRTLALGT